MNRVTAVAKRIIDAAFSALALTLLAPGLLALALIVANGLGRPVFFKQQRVGLGGKTFEIVKFRTMTNARDAHGNLFPDEKRLTRLGRTLRSLTLDELPEFWNVLKGEMSLVGPRPLPVRYLDRYSFHQRRRLEVKPGLTGWAVVQGRNTLTWEEKFDLDVWYVDHASLALDFKILVLTVGRILRRDGVNAPGHATMPEFEGSAKDQE